MSWSSLLPLLLVALSSGHRLCGSRNQRAFSLTFEGHREDETKSDRQTGRRTDRRTAAEANHKILQSRIVIIHFHGAV